MYPLLLRTYDNSGEPVKPIIAADSGLYENSEIFLLSGRDTGESVIKNGEFEDLGLNEVLTRLKTAALTPGRGFPVLIKFINTVERLPVKVYADDEYAALHGENTGKTSLIYIADCKKGAEMVYGLKRNVTPEELKTRVQNGSLSAICNFVSVQKGDVFFVPPGVVFAIGGGIAAIEISANSDSEFLISDYGRLGPDGKPRPLQINKALEVMKIRKNNLRYGNTGELTLYPFGTVRELGDCDIFSSELISMDGNVGVYEDEKIISLVLVSGEVDMSYPSGTMHLKAGNSVLIPARVKAKLSGRAEIIYTRI